MKIFSVELSYRHNRVFVVQDGANFVCHSEKCKEKRAVHMASEVSFTCDHTKLVNSYMLFTGREVRMGKNCARGLEYGPRP